MVASLKSLLIPISAPPAAFDSGSFFKNLGGDITDALQTRQAGNLVQQAATAQQATAGQPVTAIPAPGAQSQIAATAPQPGSTGGDYFSAIRAAESGGNDNASNPSSSAQGRYQFTSGTWNGLMKTHPELGLSQDGRNSPQQQELAIRAFTQDNAKQLSSSGIPVTPGNLYAAHFLGAGGAKNVLSAPDNSPLSAYVDPSAVAANPFLSNMTVADFKQWSSKKGGGGNGGYAAPTQVASSGPMVAGTAPIVGTSLPAPAVNPVASPPTQQVASAAPAGVDPNRFASGPVAQGTAGLQTAMGAQGDTTGQTPYVDPQVTTAAQGQPQGQQAPIQQPQVAQVAAPRQPTAPGILAQGVTPLSRNNLDPALLKQLVQNPITRATGLAIAQQALGGAKSADGWDFVKLDDGTFARANKQTGAVETLGNFLSAKHNIVSDGKNGLYDADAGQWITPPAGAQANSDNFFGTTIPYRDAQGVLHYRQLGKNGQGQDVQLPNGAVAAPPVKTVDTGTGTELVGPGGVSAGNIAKDVSGEAGQKTTGAAIGKAQVDLPGIVGRAQTALSSIDSLQKDPYLPFMVGAVGGTFGLLHRDELPNRSPDAARVQAKIDQIKGQSFLGVYDELRGAGAITDIEGNKGTEARARLSTAQNSEDFNAALNDLKDVIASGVARAKSMASGSTAPVPNATGAATTAPSGNIRKYNPATGKIE